MERNHVLNHSLTHPAYLILRKQSACTSEYVKHTVSDYAIITNCAGSSSLTYYFVHN